jgi:SAM-dependent methyltransferase
MSLSEVINVHRYTDADWLKLHGEIESYSIDKHVFLTSQKEIHRKGWEWTHCLFGLSELGFITPTTKALGIGAGREPVIFWLADRIQQVVATDLYGNEEWSTNLGAEAPHDILGDSQKYCPRAFRKSNVRFENVNGTKLPYPDSCFDFCWSLSSIEHFGGHDAAKKAVQEMGRVTRRGGVICIATEFLLLPEYSHPEFFTKAQIIEYLIQASSDLELVDGMTWDLPPTEYLVDQIVFGEPGWHRRRRHVVLNDGNVQWTSFMIFLQKR